jgi:hypothetical protein
MLVARSRLSEAEFERDQWRRRAEAAPESRTETGYVLRHSPVWVRLLVATSIVALGLLAGGFAFPHAGNTPTQGEDYSGCIGKARYEHPIARNQYQELVNALYACDVYRTG